MLTLFTLTKRNIKMFLKDKGLVLTSLITPMILLLLYVTFLFKVFHDSFIGNIPEMIKYEETMVNSFVATQLVSSLLAVSCVTVAFCSNAIMVSDRYTNSLKDFLVSPVKRSTIACSYYLASMLSTLIVLYIATGLSFIYIAITGWYLTAGDAFLILLDVFILVNFGTALSSVIHFFLKSQGQMSAIGAIVSSCYGFICGAYMPMAGFGEGLKNALSLLPGTYGTGLLRLHCMKSTLDAFEFPTEVTNKILEGVDAKIFFFGTEVNALIMYLILIVSTIVLIGVYILENALRKRSN